MYSLVQITKCFVFITIFGNILPLALLRRDLGIISSSREASNRRMRRQGPVIQPSWSFDSEQSLFEDYNVRVTDKKLEETEALREYIQETVDSGTYVVELDEGDFEEDELKSDEEIPVEELSEPEPELEVELKTTTVPVPEPELPTVPEQKPIPIEPQPVTKSSKFFNKFKIVPKRYLGNSPFLLWFKKKFIR